MNICIEPRLSCTRRALGAGALLLTAALATGCGGGGSSLVANDAEAQQAELEQAALKRAMSLNANTLGRVKGERSTTGGR